MINFLAAKYFVENTRSLSKVLSYSVKYGLCNVGQFGELLAQYILLQTVFQCNDANRKFSHVRRLAFRPVSLNDLLISLSGGGNLDALRSSLN